MHNKPVTSSPKITSRMKLFVDQALKNKDFWDLCCDHGYIGIHALQSENFRCIHFVDQQKHIIKNLNMRFHQSRNFLKDSYQYEFHAQDARKLSSQITGNLLIAGVGGKLAHDILVNLIQEKKLNADRILISIHSEEQKYIHLISEVLCSYTHKLSLSFQEGKRERSLEVFDLEPSQLD